MGSERLAVSVTAYCLLLTVYCLLEAADFVVGEGIEEVGRFKDDGGAADTGPDGKLFFGEDAFVNEGAQGLGQAEGRDAANGIAGDLQHFFAGGGGEAALAEVLAQGGPGDLFGAGDQKHDVVTFAEAE